MYDITERREAEEAKREQVEALALFEAVYAGAPIGVTLVSPEGRNIESNPAFLEMLGYTGDELAEMTRRLYAPRGRRTTTSSSSGT